MNHLTEMWLDLPALKLYEDYHRSRDHFPAGVATFIFRPFSRRQRFCHLSRFHRLLLRSFVSSSKLSTRARLTIGSHSWTDSNNPSRQRQRSVRLPLRQRRQPHKATAPSRIPLQPHLHLLCRTGENRSSYLIIAACKNLDQGHVPSKPRLLHHIVPLSKIR